MSIDLAITPVGLTNLTHVTKSVCSPNSKLDILSFDGTFPFPLTCNGIQTNLFPITFEVKINDETQPLTVPRMHSTLISLNGKLYLTRAHNLSFLGQIKNIRRQHRTDSYRCHFQPICLCRGLLLARLHIRTEESIPVRDHWYRRTHQYLWSALNYG